MLTTVQIRALKPAERPFKVPDSDGLFLLVQPTGAPLWRFRYKVLGIERKMSLGTFPDVSLKEARKKRDELRGEIVDGIDPVEEKRQRRLKAELAAQTTFGLVAEEYTQKMEREGKRSLGGEGSHGAVVVRLPRSASHRRRGYQGQVS